MMALIDDLAAAMNALIIIGLQLNEIELELSRGETLNALIRVRALAKFHHPHMQAAIAAFARATAGKGQP